MARSKTKQQQQQLCAAPMEKKAKKSSKRRLSNAERSSYFARREAAKVLRCVLQGDANRRAVASIKSLVYSPSVRNKKATFALVCQTLKYLPILRDVLEAAKLPNGKWKRQEELIYIITYDILFGQAVVLVGDAEKFLLLRKDALQVALAQLCVKEKVKCAEDLLPLNDKNSDVFKPRYARVNTLKVDLESAIHELGKQYMVRKDDMVPDLLVLPSGTDLHAHALVKNGSIFLQGKASSMVAVALWPEPGWEVLDACSAPGNKTVHLAALMRGKGKIIACELNKDRVKCLEETIRRSGASNVEANNGDFLNISPEDPAYSKVRAILLDPSCSGSGTANERLDHLLPSSRVGSGAADIQRVEKLAAFQSKALAHALSFPAVERVVYSTCSIYQAENEDVVKSVLSLATSLNFQLETPFPEWPRRGLPVFEGSEHLLRTDPVEDKEGFFIALFVKKRVTNGPKRPILDERNNLETLSIQASCEELRTFGHESTNEQTQLHMKITETINKKRYQIMPSCSLRMSRMMYHGIMIQRGTSERSYSRKKKRRMETRALMGIRIYHSDENRRVVFEVKAGHSEWHDMSLLLDNNSK